MSLVESYHSARQARLMRLGAIPKPRPAPTFYVTPIQSIDPEPFYCGMWFYNLITLPVAADKIQPIGRIQRAVASHFDISVEAITGGQRSKHIVLARQVGYYLVRRLTVKSTHEIGRRFKRDHSTIKHGVKKIERMLGNGELSEHINLIMARLRA